MEQLPTDSAGLGGTLPDRLQAQLLPLLQGRETDWDSVAPFPCQQDDAEHLTDLLARSATPIPGKTSWAGDSSSSTSRPTPTAYGARPPTADDRLRPDHYTSAASGDAAADRVTSALPHPAPLSRRALRRAARRTGQGRA
jgi:hypothetical protein